MSKDNSLKLKKVDMTNGPVFGPLLMYCLPIMLTGMLQLLFNAADIAVVGRFEDPTSVAAVSSCSSLIQLIINLFVGVSLGSSVVLASAIGSKQEKDYDNIVHTTFSLGIIFGIIAGIIGVVFARTFLTWMETPDDVIDKATLYLRIYMAGNPAFMIYTFGRAIIVAVGDTRKPLIYLSISGVLNIILNIILVAGCGMGVAGVGIATVSSQVLSAVLMTGTLLKLTGPIRLKLSKIRINMSQLKRILGLGLPVGLQNTLFSISNVIIQTSINLLGTAFVAGNGAAASIDGFVYIAMNSVTQGCMTFAGQNYGAGRYDRLGKIYKTSLGIISVAGLVLGGLVYLAGHPLLAFILSSNKGAEAIEYGMIRLMFIALPNFTCGLMDCGSGMLRGMNRSFFPMVATVLGSCGLRLLWVAIVFNPYFETHSAVSSYIVLLLSYPISWVITYAVLLWYYFRVKKQLFASQKTYKEQT